MYCQSCKIKNEKFKALKERFNDICELRLLETRQLRKELKDYKELNDILKDNLKVLKKKNEIEKKMKKEEVKKVNKEVKLVTKEVKLVKKKVSTKNMPDSQIYKRYAS